MGHCVFRHVLGPDLESSDVLGQECKVYSCAVGHSVAFSHVLWVRVQNLVMCYGPECSI
jgi:hypothetical protein